MRRAALLFCCPALGLALTGCATAVSTSSFKGEQHQVAQTIANLQSDATAGDEKKICTNDLARAVITRLGGSKRCESAIKEQLDQVDNLEVSVQSVALSTKPAASKATLPKTAASKTALPKGAASKTSSAETSGAQVQTATAQVKSVHAGKHRQSTVSLVKEGGKWKISGLG